MSQPPDTVPANRDYQLYGLTLRSELPLPTPAIRLQDSPQLQVRWGEPRSVPREIPAGRVLSQLMLGPGNGNVAVADEAGYLLRYLGSCEFRISKDLKHITAHPDPAQGADYAPLFLAGNVMAFLLTLLGKTVLHASAVEQGGRALGFVGPSGQGKSTMAALCCAAGARLVTDDLLALEAAPDGRLLAPKGPIELRLRPGAREFAGHWQAAEHTLLTADARHIGRPPATPLQTVELAALVLPSPHKDSTELKVTRLSPKEAFQGIAGHSRWGSWREPEVLKRETAMLTRIARQVPVYHAQIPWGPPFQPGVGDRLLAVVA